MRRIISVSLVLSIAALLATCSSSGEPAWSDDPCDPNYAHSRMTVIGPEGGSVDIYDHPDVSHPLEGFRLTVPAGAWAECWEVVISASTFGWDTPGYPAGFLPVMPAPDGSVEFSIFRQTETGGKVYAPDSMYAELSFALKTIPSDSRDYVFAFVFDSTAMDWRVLLPDEVDANHLTVHISDWKRQWSFGRIDLTEVDFEAYLAPALAEQIGTDTWNRIHTSLDSLYTAAVSAPTSLDCSGLDLLEGVFATFRNQSATKLQEIDAAIQCGDCDATTGQFWEGWGEYVEQKQWGLFADLAVDVAGQITHAHWLVELGGSLVVGAIIDAMARDFACDYECFEESITPAFYWHLAGFAASAAIVYVIQWYRSNYTSCAAPPGGGAEIGASAGLAPVAFCAGPAG